MALAFCADVPFKKLLTHSLNNGLMMMSGNSELWSLRSFSLPICLSISNRSRICAICSACQKSK